MGKKVKVGKQRKDKFYKLAKETGYRSRAAFKLIQLNRKFEFLQRSRVLVDLCAAPGGWLQVAQKFMPVSSVILGVDLAPIKQIQNVTTCIADITTNECKQFLKKELKTWKVDVFLNDGAPNVGKNWLHDSYAQIRLTLSALQLATEFLIKGGWFITKVFRSKDYDALLWVFGKLFKKVSATKPQASRSESAEIFVVCEKYLAPDNIDPKFFDANYIFKEIDTGKIEKHMKNQLLKPVHKQKKPRAFGYDEDNPYFDRKLLATDFLKSDSHLELLSKSHSIEIDDDDINNHPLSTDELKLCMEDLKVLGRKDLLRLIQWRKKVREDLISKGRTDLKEIVVEEINDDLPPVNDESTVAPENDDDIPLETDDMKKKRKKVLKARRKLNEKLNLKMVLKNDQIMDADLEVFNLTHLKNKSDIEKFQEIELSDDENVENNIEDDGEIDLMKKTKKNVFYDKDEKIFLGDDDSDIASRTTEDITSDKEFDIDEDEEKFKDVEEADSDYGIPDEDDDDDEENKISKKKKSKSKIIKTIIERADDEDSGLIVSLEDKKSKLDRARMFFDKDTFNEMDDDEADLEIMLDDGKKSRKRTKKEESNDEDDDDDSCSDEEMLTHREKRRKRKKLKAEKKDDKQLKLEEKCKKKYKLDPEALAIAETMISSEKVKRDLIDDGWNRYVRGVEEDLPSWFKEDEEKHNRPMLPVDEKLVEEYKLRMRDINARPIKKVAEAKARKKKRAVRRLERARKKAERITDTEDMSEAEKASHIKSLYKKAVKNERDKKLTYVVAKKGVPRRRPAGVKGRYKMVDSRMRKDNFKEKKKMKKTPKSKVYKPKQRSAPAKKSKSKKRK